MPEPWLHKIDWLLAGYLLVGVGGWLLAWVGMFFAKARMNKLFAPAEPLPPDPPHVSIVVPAKDEADHIEACVRGLLQQDYPNFDVVVVDDRSRDATRQILHRLLQEERARGSCRLQVVHVDTLPDGWLGKCHALYVGTRHVRSPWILFVDSDIALQPQALRTVLARAVARGYDAVSILNRLEGRTLWERLMIPVCGATWAAMFLISRTNEDSRPRNAAANGQFLLVRREAYEAVGGHQRVRQQIVEDVELMRAVKAADFKCRLYVGTHLASMRMHATLAELRSGWGRIFAGTARFRRWRPVLAGLFVLFGGLGVYFGLAYGVYRLLTRNDWSWLAAAGVHWVLMSGFLLELYRVSRSRMRYALIPFVSFPVLLWLIFEGLRRCGDRRFVWRGTEFAVPPEALESAEESSPRQPAGNSPGSC
ncbi:MAG: glycosyltransferase [Phycisphaerales bacterium]|nr:glycosyltransferase [Phycisphaerales bacterium]